MDPRALYQRFGREFPAGSVLFRQGDPGKEMYVISSGRVQISRHLHDKETVLAVLPAGEFFGEMAIVNDRPRSATATVIEDAKLLVLDAGTFESMIRTNAEIAVRMIKKLAGRLDATGRQVEVLLLRDPNSRVVHCLRQEAEDAGTPDPTGIAVQITEQQLGERLGLSHAEVRVVVDRLERARLVSRREQGGFVVAEVGRLHDFLEFLEMRERYGQV